MKGPHLFQFFPIMIYRNYKLHYLVESETKKVRKTSLFSNKDVVKS